MNKDSIYKIIGYNGEYNASVKKAIRKLLKENHPDNNGDRKIFELINEVKNELEDNRVSYNQKHETNTVNTIDDIDYGYCFEMIKSLNKEKNICTNNLNKLNNKLEKYVLEYKKKYQEDIELETDLLSNSKYVDSLKKTKYQCIFCLLLAIVVFAISVWKRDLFFLILFTFIAIACILIINKLFLVMQKFTESGKSRLKKYVDTNSKLRNNLKEQEEIKKEIHDIKKHITNLENDLRFYNNIFKSRR